MSWSFQFANTYGPIFSFIQVYSWYCSDGSVEGRRLRQGTVTLICILYILKHLNSSVVVKKYKKAHESILKWGYDTFVKDFCLFYKATWAFALTALFHVTSFSLFSSQQKQDVYKSSVTMHSVYDSIWFTNHKVGIESILGIFFLQNFNEEKLTWHFWIINNAKLHFCLI